MKAMKVNINIILALLVCIVIWVGIGVDRYIEYYSNIDIMKTNIKNISLLTSEEMNLSIYNIDQLLLSMLDESNLISIDKIFDLASHRIKLNTYIKQITITASDGNVAYTTAPNKIINFNDRYWFQITKTTRNLIISNIVKSRLTGDFTVPFVRGVYDNNGIFKGTFHTTMNVDYFDQFYKGLDVGKNGSMVVIGMDQYIRFKKYSGIITYEEFLKTDHSYMCFKEHNFENGIYYIDKFEDGIARYVGFYKLKDYPLFIAIGMSVSEYMHGYYVTTVILVGIGLFFNILILFLLRLERKSFWLLQNQYTLMENKANIIEIQRNELAQQYDVMNELKEIAEKSDKLKSTFISNMSHELRTPLNIIIGYAELLLSFEFDEKTKDKLNSILQSGQHLLDMISSILDLSKIESGTFGFNCEHYYIYESINECYEMVEMQLYEKNLILEAQETKIVVYADKIRVKQALMNIISNSIKFTKIGGIAINVFEVGNSVNISIQDTGVGMDEEGLKVCIHPFGQIRDELNRNYEGTGLGLPLTKKIIEGMGGNFEIKSELNIGTLVNIQLPKGDVNKFEGIQFF